MPYDPKHRSELELRFESLFQEVFSRHVEDVLVPQYQLSVKGKVYRIDYAYVRDGHRIAIELDGYGKINHGKAFNNLLARQNDIVAAGFTIYRFGWDHVVKQNGWEARNQLQAIFKDKFNCPKSTNKSSYQAKSTPFVPPSTYSPIYPLNPPTKRTSHLRVLSAIGLILIFILALSSISQSVQSMPEPNSAGIPTPTKINFNSVEPKPVHVVVPVKPISSKQSGQSKKDEEPSISKIKPIVQEVASPAVVSDPIETAEAQSPPINDVLVVFSQANPNELKYHKPGCKYAKLCLNAGKNCIQMFKSEAEHRHARPAGCCH